MKKDTLWRVLPFAVFMAFIGFFEVPAWFGIELAEKTRYLLYPVRIAVVGALLLIFCKKYVEVDWKDITSNLPGTALSVAAGLVVFILWINMDWAGPLSGDGGGYDPTVFAPGAPRTAIMAVRLLGAAVVVPVMEELFWRSFLVRYIIDPDFTRVPIGRFTLASFAVSAALFGVEHDLIYAGIMAGAAYNLLLYRTKSIAQCILAHGVTNLALGIYVIQTGNWRFW